MNEQARDNIGTDVNTVVTSARDVSRCARQCPSTGTLDIAFGQGEILRVVYQDGNTARVTGPRGTDFEFELECGRQ